MGLLAGVRHPVTPREKAAAAAATAAAAREAAYTDGQRRLLHTRQMAEMALARDEARVALLPFCQLMRPDPQDPDNAKKSAFMVSPQAKLLCEVIEKAERRQIKRVAVSIGPQLGKSEVLSRMAPAWLSGRDPTMNMILGAYNQDFAEEFGGDVRTITRSPPYRKTFPNHGLQTGSTAKDYMVTTDGGKLAFVGVGGSGSGKPADFFFVDDPMRNDEDAQSASYREKQWKWFNGVVFARCHNDTVIVVVHTRWHEDDLIGRLCDPEHPERNTKYRGIADKWTYINLPAVVEDPALAASLGLTLEPQTDPEVVRQFGSKPISALWGWKKNLELLAEARMNDSRTFDSLYMGLPAPEDGAYFKSEMIVEYQPHELPDDLVYYGASDHAVTENQKNDPNCIGCVGVDANDDIWVLPDVTWEHMETDRAVEALLYQMKAHKPSIWWMESELISKSFGPFLRKRMSEEKVYCLIDHKTPGKDKRSRARAIQGRMSMRKVRFPAFAPWWGKARSEILKFPFGAHDDFVDWLSWIGLGLMREQGADRPSVNSKVVPITGTIGWVLSSSDRQKRREKMLKSVAGF